MRVVYVIGYPGAGKSTAVAGALRLLDVDRAGRVEVPKPFAHVRMTTGAGETLWQLGKDRVPFGGTDTLGMAVSPLAIDWVSDLPRLGVHPDVLLGEGDRLATRGFLTACAHDCHLAVALIDVLPSRAAERSKARAAEHGLPEQNESWAKGRYTKVENLWRWAQQVESDNGRIRAHRIGGSFSPDEVAERLAGIIQPGCVSP